MNKTAMALISVIVLLGLSLGLSGAANSKVSTSPAPDAPKKLCERIVDQTSHGKRKGLDLITENMAYSPTSALGKELQEAHTRQQVGMALDVQEKYGSYLGCELADERNLSGSLRKYVYMAKFERGVMRWTFICYRPHDTWKILGVIYKDVVNDLAQ